MVFYKLSTLICYLRHLYNDAYVGIYTMLERLIYFKVDVHMMTGTRE